LHCFQGCFKIKRSWLTQYDVGELTIQEVESAMMSEYEAKIAALLIWQILAYRKPVAKSGSA
jgi:hypothetical protein